MKRKTKTKNDATERQILNSYGGFDERDSKDVLYGAINEYLNKEIVFQYYEKGKSSET